MANPRPQREAILGLVSRQPQSGLPPLTWAKTGDLEVEVFSVGESPIALHGISKPNPDEPGPWVAVFAFGDVDADAEPLTWDELRRCVGAVLILDSRRRDFSQEVIPLRSVRSNGTVIQFEVAGDPEPYNPI